MAYPNQVRHVRSGESVTAGITSRSTRELAARTDYLKSLLEALDTLSGVMAYDETVEETVKVGQPVFYNAATQRFEAALAAVDHDVESGTLVANASCFVLGVVHAKTNATLANIQLSGKGTIDLTEALPAGEELAAGVYYLSSAEAGKLTRQRPAVTVAVLYADGQGTVYVNPQVKDFVEDHVHYSFDLVCRPAGRTVPPASGERHLIFDADVDKPGWLPASHSIFSGRAPSRAAFGYNLSQHTALQRVFPPIPLSAVSMMLDKGEHRLGGTEIPLGSDGLAIINRDGIWWMSDCYGDVPWPTELDTDNSMSSSISSEGPECLRHETMRITLNFVRMTYATDRSVVTALTAEDSSPLSFVNCDGQPASTGDLVARFDAQFMLEGEADESVLAVKSLDGSKLVRGPVVTGLIAGNDNLELSGSTVRDIAGQTVYSGLVTASVNLDPAARDLSPQVVRLDQVRERFSQDVLYLGFPAEQEGALRAKVKIPSAGLPANAEVTLRFQLLAGATGTLPSLSLSYRILPRPGSSPEDLPSADTSLELVTATAAEAGQYVEVESDSVEVSAGDTLLFTLSRADDDGYAGEVGVLDMVGVLTGGA